MGVSFLALMAPTAHAQMAPKPAAPPPSSPYTSPRPAPQPATPAQAEAAKFLVFFDWDRSALTPEGRAIVASAADEFKRTGTTRIVATGHTDLSGSPQYNQRLSERRAEAVKVELIRLGVPAMAITTIGKGEEDPLLPTKDGVREAQNRRVEIVIPRPPKPAEPPKPVTAAPAAPPPPPPAPLKWEASLGPWYGYNLRETDRNDDLTSNLLGPELRLGYSLSPNWQLFADGVLFNTIGTSAKDGWGARGIAGLSHVWNAGAWHPFIGPHVGYIAGRGVQDGVVAGPELGVNYDVHRNLFLYARAAYDNNFRNDFGQGIINGGLGAGYRW
jgi:outer membrane protein OmpA-like peptidoglycan-associated protein